MLINLANLQFWFYHEEIYEVYDNSNDYTRIGIYRNMWEVALCIRNRSLAHLQLATNGEEFDRSLVITTIRSPNDINRLFDRFQSATDEEEFIEPPHDLICVSARYLEHSIHYAIKTYIRRVG